MSQSENPYKDYQNWNYQSFTGTNTFPGSGTIGGFVNCAPSEREKFCPRDGVMFGERDNYCSRCGRPVGWLSQGYLAQPYTSPWQPNITWTQAAQQNQQYQLTLETNSGSE